MLNKFHTQYSSLVLLKLYTLFTCNLKKKQNTGKSMVHHLQIWDPTTAGSMSFRQCSPTRGDLVLAAITSPGSKRKEVSRTKLNNFSIV